MTSFIEVVVLDMGGVVCHFRPERRLQELADLTGRSPEEIHDAVWASGLDARADRGAFGPAEAYAQVCDRLGAALTVPQLRTAWATAFEPDRALVGLVSGVRRPTVLFTNNGPIVEDCLANELVGVTTAFDQVLLSWRLGAVKPDPEAFAQATDALGVTPSSVLFVDDSLPSVRAAAHHGWIAHRFRGARHLAELLRAHQLLA